MKWTKHLLLSEWKLREMKDLLHTIRRYPAEDSAECLEEIRREMEAGIWDVFVIKVVESRRLYRLPNLVVRMPGELAEAASALRTYARSASEVWFCGSRSGGETVFGRMLIPWSELFPRCHLDYELVWSSTARTIDQYPASGVPYLRCGRVNWNGEICTAELRPEGRDPVEMERTVRHILRLLAGFTREAASFAHYVFSVGCRFLCLEFRYENGCLRFTDWDTDNDALILGRRNFYACLCG